MNKAERKTLRIVSSDVIEPVTYTFNVFISFIPECANWQLMKF